MALVHMIDPKTNDELKVPSKAVARYEKAGWTRKTGTAGTSERPTQDGQGKPTSKEK